MKLEHTEKAIKLLDDRIKLMNDIESLTAIKNNKDFNIKIQAEHLHLFNKYTWETPMSDKVVEFAITEMQTRLAQIEIEILEL